MTCSTDFPARKHERCDPRLVHLTPQNLHLTCFIIYCTVCYIRVFGIVAFRATLQRLRVAADGLVDSTTFTVFCTVTTCNYTTTFTLHVKPVLYLFRTMLTELFCHRTSYM